MTENLNLDSTWKSKLVPRGKCHNKTETKTTISLYLNRILVERARKHRLNLSRITEQALNSILDYMETQNLETSSDFVMHGSCAQKLEWAGEDLNPRPLARKANVLTKLDDRPSLIACSRSC
jgi:hypothetical protein